MKQNLPRQWQTILKSNPNLRAVGGSHFVINVAGDDLDITFLPDQVGGLSNYIRNRAILN